MQRVVGEMYWLILTDTFPHTEDKQKRYILFYPLHKHIP